LPVSLLILVIIFLLSARAADAVPTCARKKATIVSDAHTIIGTKAPDVIVAGPSDNIIHGEGGNDTICGGGGDDAIYGDRGMDHLYGQGGDDTLDGGRGGDHLDGGAGNDTLIGDRGSDTLEGGPGTDHLQGDSGNDHLDGGAGDGDVVDEGPGDGYADGGPGDYDVVIGGTGNDRLSGGPGAHDIVSYKGVGGAVTINLQTQRVSGAEDERISGFEDAIGGSGDDTIIGSSTSSNRLDGGPGDDHLLAVGPDDQAFGGPGSDDCSGDFSQETSCGPTAGTAGTAVELYQSIDGATDLIITGNAGDDSVSVSNDAAGYTVQGTGPEQVLLGDPSSTACVQSPIVNAVSCNGQVGQILASLNAGDDTFSYTGSTPVVVDGGPGSDAITGGNGDDILYGGDDHVPDVLNGGGGNDVLYGVNIFHPRKPSGAAIMNGGPGSDLMVGGQPCDGDSFNGGPGPNDSASFSRVRNSGIFVRAQIGGTVTDPDVSHCTPGHISSSTEKIEGSPGPDQLFGDNQGNVLLGRGGNDQLDGEGGHDTCIGGGGHDRATQCEDTHSVP